MLIRSSFTAWRGSSVGNGEGEGVIWFRTTGRGRKSVKIPTIEEIIARKLLELLFEAGEMKGGEQLYPARGAKYEVYYANKESTYYELKALLMLRPYYFPLLT